MVGFSSGYLSLGHFIIHLLPTLLPTAQFTYGAYVYFLDSGFPIFGSSVFWIILVSVPALSGFSLMVISVCIIWLSQGHLIYFYFSLRGSLTSSHNLDIIGWFALGSRSSRSQGLTGLVLLLRSYIIYYVSRFVLDT